MKLKLKLVWFNWNFILFSKGDFGFAKTMSDSTKFTNTKLGTQFYAAPEIRKNLPYNNKLDIWGIGMILLDLLLPEVWNPF